VAVRHPDEHVAVAWVAATELAHLPVSSLGFARAYGVEVRRF